MQRRHACYLAQAGSIEPDVRYIREVSRTIGAFLVRAVALHQMAEGRDVPDVAFASSVKQKG